MMQLPTIQSTPMQAANYNAVKIDINNPSVVAPGANQGATNPMAEVAKPIYNVPTASVYEVPQKSIYGEQSNFKSPEAAPAVPAPVIVKPTVTQTPEAPKAPAVPIETKAPEAPKAEAAPIEAKAPEAPATTPAPVEAKAPEAPAAPAKSVEVKAPEAAAPQVNLDAVVAKLTDANYDTQATAMEEIADLAQNSPQKATELLDTKVFDTLLSVLGTDTSKLAGPTPKQLEIREKIMNKQPVTDAETAEANTITPMEQAERNKQYAMYTTAILQKLYGSEIQKMNNTVVPLTELPGIAGIVEQVKNNPNPMVRASGVDSLSYIQAPEYKQDLSSILTIAQKDKDPNVQQAATKALEKLAQVSAPAAPAAAPASAEPAKVA